MFDGIFGSTARILNKLPGKKIFGIYRFLPIFFLLGASLEFSMIKWEVGPNKVNFYKTFTKNAARQVAEREILDDEWAAAKAAREARAAPLNKTPN